MKYIIEVTKIEGTDLYKAKGFNTLVFDQKGLEKLECLSNQIEKGDIVKTINGTKTYEYLGLANDEITANLMSIDSGKCSSVPFNKLIKISNTEIDFF